MLKICTPPIGIIFPIWTTPKQSISNYQSHCMCKTTWINILLQIFVKLKKKDVSCSFLSLQLPWFYRLILFHSKLKLIPIVNVSDRKLGYKYLPFELNAVGRTFPLYFSDAASSTLSPPYTFKRFLGQVMLYGYPKLTNLTWIYFPLGTAILQ